MTHRGRTVLALLTLDYCFFSAQEPCILYFSNVQHKLTFLDLQPKTTHFSIKKISVLFLVVNPKHVGFDLR